MCVVNVSELSRGDSVKNADSNNSSAVADIDSECANHVHDSGDSK